MYLEPCCIHNQLTPLLLTNEVFYFHSGGDILLSKVIAAITHVVPQATLTLCLVHAPDVFTLRQLKTLIEHNCVKQVQVICSQNCADLFKTEIPAFSAPGADKVPFTFVHDSTNATHMLCMASESAYVVVNGYLPLTIENRFITYCCTTTYNAYMQATEVLRSKLKLYGHE